MSPDLQMLQTSEATRKYLQQTFTNPQESQSSAAANIAIVVWPEMCLNIICLSAHK